MTDVDDLAATIRAALSDAVFHGEVGYEQAVEALDVLVAEARRRRADEWKRRAEEAEKERDDDLTALDVDRAKKMMRLFREGKYIAVHIEEYRKLTAALGSSVAAREDKP